MGKDRQLVLVGTLCFFTTGCFSYGPYGHPGMMAPPHTAMAPQPYGTVQVPPGAVWVPASPAGASTLTAPTPVRKSGPTSFENDHEPATGKSVPEPTDPGKAKPQEETDSFGFNDDAQLERLGVKTSQSVRPRPLADEEFTESELELAEPEMAVATDDEPRLPRSSVRSAEFRTQVRSDSVTPASATVATFGYDTEAYTWLRGIIEYDPKHKVWHLTYSQSPDDSDQFGGEVTLKNPEHFKFLRSGQVVSVVGEFDATQRDRLGKPVYEVSELTPVGKR
jgi:hypothetical protein